MEKNKAVNYLDYLTNEELEEVSGQLSNSLVEASLEVLRADARAQKLNEEVTSIRRRITARTMPAIPSVLAQVIPTIPAPPSYEDDYVKSAWTLFNESLDYEDREILDQEEETAFEINLADIEHLL